jgi:CheY-like chemotaxis protein
MKTVLVAEDRDTSRELIRIMLEHAGFSVLEAANGAEAIAIAREKNPDLVLLDLQMPIKDGFDVLADLRTDSRFASTPIIAVTASAMQGDQQRALQSGFTAYLTKPLSFTTLRMELDRVFPNG